MFSFLFFHFETQRLRVIFLECCVSVATPRTSGTMGLGIWSLIKACLLLTNACAILHETRFLPSVGIPHVSGPSPASVNENAGVKLKIAGLLNAVRYLRVPLIFINLLAVIFELLLG